MNLIFLLYYIIQILQLMNYYYYLLFVQNLFFLFFRLCLDVCQVEMTIIRKVKNCQLCSLEQIYPLYVPPQNITSYSPSTITLFHPKVSVILKYVLTALPFSIYILSSQANYLHNNDHNDD